MRKAHSVNIQIVSLYGGNEMKSMTRDKAGYKKSFNILGSKRAHDYFWGYMMIMPTIGGLAIFYVVAFFQNLYYSFTDLGSFGKYSWIGLDWRIILNY